MWKNININKNQIKINTGKSVLIKMPNNSKYAGYVFWHPLKLVRSGRHSASYSLGYSDEFTFNLIKHGKKVEVGVEEFEEAFTITDENIKSHKLKIDYETHKPTPIEAVEVEIEEELKDE